MTCESHVFVRTKHTKQTWLSQYFVPWSCCNYEGRNPDLTKTLVSRHSQSKFRQFGFLLWSCLCAELGVNCSGGSSCEATRAAGEQLLSANTPTSHTALCRFPRLFPKCEWIKPRQQWNNKRGADVVGLRKEKSGLQVIKFKTNSFSLSFICL